MMRSIITFLLLLLGSTAFAVAANTIELDESIFTGSYTNATGSYSDLYFGVDNNNLGGAIFWIAPKILATPETVSFDGNTKTCHKQLRGLYNNSARGNVLWPLDDTALTHLQDTALGYQNITVAGGLFIECEGEDPYAVFGQVMHTRNGETYYIIAGAEFTGNSYTTSFANTWTWLSADNALATGQLFDSYAGVASLSGYGSIQVPEYDLLITKTANKTSAGKGEEVTYTIDFTNSGNATTDNIQVTDTILTGFEISDYTVTGPSSHTFSTGINASGGLDLTWSDMSLGANETGRITLTIAAPRTLGQISPVQSGVVMDFDGVEHLVGTLSSDISMNKDYTISMWLRPEVTDDAASHIQVMHNVIGSSDRNVISIEDNAIRFGGYNGAAWLAKSHPVVPNERIHIVGINDGQTISFYVNGVAATGALAPYARNVNGFRLGGGAGGTIPYQGQVSDMTIYNRAISPAEAADLYNHTIVTNGLVSRHKLDEGAGKTAFDSYGSAELTRSNNLYVTDGEIHSLQNDLGYSNALSFDGANDYLQTAADADFAFGTEPFTIDTRVYIAGTQNQVILGNGFNSDNGWMVYLDSADALRFHRGAAWVYIDSTFSLGERHHIAVVREGVGANQLKTYVDGVNTYVTTYSESATSPDVLQVGKDPLWGNYLLNGQLKNVRITKGEALWTGNFTPPKTDTDYQVSSATTLLIKGESPDGTTMLDSSPSAHTFTNNGGVTQVNIPRDETNRCFDVIGTQLDFVNYGFCNYASIASPGESNTANNQSSFAYVAFPYKINTAYVEVPNTSNTGLIIETFIELGYQQGAGALNAVSAETLVGSKQMNLTNNSSGTICPQVPLIFQSLNTEAGNIAEIEFPGCFVVKDSVGNPYNGMIESALFDAKDEAFELINTEIVSLMSVGSSERLNLFDTGDNNITATVRMPAPGYTPGTDLTVFFSEDASTWNTHSTETVTDINGESYIEFTTDHFTYFALGTETGNFVINADAATTVSTGVTLNMTVSGAVDMRFGNTTAERDAASWVSYATTYPWTLTEGGELKTVYAEFRNASGETGYVEDTITLLLPPDLSITKTADKVDVIQGEILTYTIDFANEENTAATGIEITDTLISGLSLVNRNFDGPSYTFGSVTNASGDLEMTWSDITLGANETGSIVLTAQVLGDFVSAGPVQSGKAFSFDGSNDSVVLSSLSSRSEFMSFPNGFTVSFWAKTDTNVGYWLTRRGSTNGFGLNANFRYIGNGSARTTANHGILTDNVRHNYMAIRNGSTWTSYRDGTQIDSVAMTNPTFTNPTNNQLAIGMDNRNNLSFSNQEMYDVRIYNEALDATARTTVLNQENHMTGLILRYKMDEGAGSIAYDSSSNENHGTIQNTQASFYTTHDEYSFQNNNGRTEGDGTNGASSGVAIPRDELYPVFDVLGNQLQYNGARGYVFPALYNTVTITGVAEANTANNTATLVSESHEEIINLSITKTADRASAARREELNYVIKVENHGNTTKTGIRVFDTLQSGVDLLGMHIVGITADITTGYNASGDLDIEWSNITLDEFSSGTIILNTQVVGEFVNVAATQSGRVYSFDGSDDYVSTPATVSSNQSHTLAVKFKVTETQSERAQILGSSLGGGGTPTALAITTANEITYYINGTTHCTVGGVQFNQRYDIVGTFDAATNTRKLYVDGTEVCSEVEAPASYTANVTLGRNNFGTQYFKGLAYDARVFDRAVTSGEVTSIGNHEAVTSGLVARYKMDEAAGTTAYDSRSTNNGTLNGGVSHVTDDDAYSFQNNNGWTDGNGTNGAAVGVYIPRDEALTGYDVLGNVLEYDGAIGQSIENTAEVEAIDGESSLSDNIMTVYTKAEKQSNDAFSCGNSNEDLIQTVVNADDGQHIYIAGTFYGNFNCFGFDVSAHASRQNVYIAKVDNNFSGVWIDYIRADNTNVYVDQTSANLSSTTTCTDPGAMSIYQMIEGENSLYFQTSERAVRSRFNDSNGEQLTNNSVCVDYARGSDTRYKVNKENGALENSRGRIKYGGYTCNVYNAKFTPPSTVTNFSPDRGVTTWTENSTPYYAGHLTHYIDEYTIVRYHGTNQNSCGNTYKYYHLMTHDTSTLLSPTSIINFGNLFFIRDIVRTEDNYYTLEAVHGVNNGNTQISKVVKYDKSGNTLIEKVLQAPSSTQNYWPFRIDEMVIDTNGDLYIKGYVDDNSYMPASYMGIEIDPNNGHSFLLKLNGTDLSPEWIRYTEILDDGITYLNYNKNLDLVEVIGIFNGQDQDILGGTLSNTGNANYYIALDSEANIIALQKVQLQSDYDGASEMDLFAFNLGVQTYVGGNFTLNNYIGESKIQSQGDYDIAIGQLQSTSAFSINYGAIFTSGTQVSLVSNIDSLPGKTPVAMKICNDPTFPATCVWEPYQSITSWMLDGADGDKNVYIQYQVLDDQTLAVDIIDATDGITLDATGPWVENISPLSGTILNLGQVNLIRSGSDETSGVSGYIYEIISGGIVVYSGEKAQDQTGVVIGGLNNGTYTWHVKAEDKAGNWSAFTDERNFTIDAIPLTVHFTGATPADGTVDSTRSFLGEVEVLEPNLLNLTWTRDTTDYIFNISGRTDDFGTGDYSLTDYTDPSLVLAMNFDSAGDISDYSSQANDGTSYGTTTRTSAGKFNGAYEFDGSTATDYITVPATVSADITDTITVSARVYSNSNAGTRLTIVSEAYEGDGIVEYAFFNQDGQLGAGFFNGSWYTLIGGDIPLNTWTHIVSTYDGHYIKNYINGELTSSSSDLNTALPSGSETWRIGRRWDASGVGNQFNGLIDDVRIYNRAISDNEVYNMYSTSLTRVSTGSWLLNTNQEGLDYGLHIYQACASNTSFSSDCTEERSYGVPELQISKKSNTGTYYGLDYITYTIDLSSTPGISTTGFIVTDTLVTGLQYISHDLIGSASHSFSTGLTASGDTLLTWSGFDLGAGATGAIILTAQVVQDFGRQSAPITGTAYDFVADQGHIFVPDSTDFGVWTNYTVSAWINPDNIANDHKGIVGNHNGNGFIFALQNNDNNSLEFWTNSVWAQNGPSIAEDGTWKHVVFACNNGSAYFYLDGVATSASCIPTADGGDIYIGGGGASWLDYRFDGKISDVRIFDRYLDATEVAQVYNHETITSGLVAHYKLSEPDGNIAYDAYGDHHGTVVGSVTKVEDPTVYDFNKRDGFSDGELYFGNNDYLRVPASSDFAFGTDPFTIDTWVWINGATNDAVLGNGYNVANGWMVYNDTADALRFHRGDAWVYIQENVPNNERHHIAVVREGAGANQLKTYFDGQLSYVSTYSESATSPNDLYIGYDPGRNQYLDGNIRNIRISKGIARWTGNFTPPTTYGPQDAYTKLLILDNDLTDSSPSAHTVINNGVTSTLAIPSDDANPCFDILGHPLQYLNFGICNSASFAASSEDTGVMTYAYASYDKPNVYVTQIAPTDGSSLAQSSIDFSWTGAVEGGGTIAGYTYEISTTADFASIYTGGTVATTGVTLDMDNGTFYWRVKSRDTSVNESEWSPTRSFSVTGPEADIRLTKTSDHEQAGWDDIITYTIDVVNTGTKIANNMTLSDTLVSGLDLLSRDATGLGSYNFSSGTNSSGELELSWDNIALDIGETGAIVLTAQVTNAFQNTLPLQSGNAYYFNGSSADVTVPSYGLIAPTEEASISLRVNTVVKSQVAFSIGTDGANRILFHPCYSDGNTYFDFGNSTVGRLSYTNPANCAGDRHHYTLISSKTQNKMEIYRDGVLEASGNFHADFTTADLELSVGSSTYQGDMRDLRIYDRVLSTGEIAQVYNQEVVTSGLLSRYRMDEAGGWTMYDAQGGYHGTLNGDVGHSTSNQYAMQRDLGYNKEGLFFDDTRMITAPNSTDFDFGNGNFTIDRWEKRKESQSANGVLARDNGAAPGYNAFLLGYSNNAIYMSSNGSSRDIASNRTLGTPVYGDRSHLSVVRNGNTFYSFRDGVQQDTWTSSATLLAGRSPLQIGRYHSSQYLQDTFIKNLRISKGIARWTGNYTVPETYEMDSYTTLFIGNSIEDQSNFAHTLTNYGVTDEYIPRDEQNILYDVLGDPLEYFPASIANTIYASYGISIATGATHTFFIDDEIAPIVENISPAHQSVIETGTVDLIWSGSDESSGLSGYVYELSKEGSVILSGTRQATQTGVTIINLQNGSSYTWHVKAQDKAGNWSEFTDEREFTFTTLDVTSPIIYFTGVTPTDGIVTQNTTFTGELDIREETLSKFVWSRDATDYIFDIGANSAGDFGIGDYSLTDYTDTGLVLAMNFDTDGDVNDYSPYQYDGTNNGAIWISSGYYGGSLSFDGNDFVQIPSNTLNNLSSGTFSARVNLKNLNKQQSIIDKTEYTVKQYIQMIVESDNRIRVRIDGGPYMYSSSTLDSDVWYNVVLTWDQTQRKLYINNQLNVSVNSTLSVPTITNDVFIGKVAGNSAFMDGYIDDVRVYNYALSTGKIDQKYNTTVHKYSDALRGVDVNEKDLVDGTYTYQAFATDAAGQTGETSLRSYTVDTTAPSIENISPLSGTVIYTGTVTLTRSGSDATSSVSGYQYELLSGGVVILSGNRTQTGVTITNLSEVSYTWHVRAQDLAGNWSAFTDEREFSYEQPILSIYFTGATPADGAKSSETTFTGEAEAVVTDLQKLIWTRDTTDYIFDIGANSAGDFGIGDYSMTDYSDTGLVLAMNFDTDGDTSDYSTYGNDGTNNGATWTGEGKYNGAYDFDGSSYVSIPNPSEITSTTGLTVSMWVKESTVNGTVISRWESTNGFGLHSNNSWYLGDSSSRTSIPAGRLADNQRHMYTLIRDGSVMTSYRDAVSYSSASMTSAQFPAPINDIILLGGDNRNMTINFNGQIDDVRIYTNAITEEQLKRIYNTQVQKLSNTQRSLTSQEKNLDYGIYSYQACVQDIRGTTVCTDARSYERAGLWIEKRSDKTSYYALDYITYTIDVGAYADANFTGIEIDEKLLTGLEYVSHTTQNLGTPTLSTGYNTTGDLLFNWSDISLSGGDQGTIILTAQIVNQFPPIEQPPVPYAESGFLTEEFWNNSPTDQEIVDALFSTDSAYTQHRNNYSDSTCSVGSSNVVHLYDGGSIPSPFTTNTIYVLHSGSYVTSDYTRMAECTAIIGEGDVNISTSTALTSNYAGTIRANCSSQVIVDNIKIDGQKGHATKNAIGIMMFNNCANSLYNYTINNTETYNNSSMGIYIRSREQDATTVAKTLGYGLVNNCRSYSNGAGVALNSSMSDSNETIYLRNNIINNCQLFNNNIGLALSATASDANANINVYADYNTVNNTQIYNNQYGVNMAASCTASNANCTVRNNTLYNIDIYNNIYGLRLVESTTLGEVANNNFVDLSIYNNTEGVVLSNVGTNSYYGDLIMYDNDTEFVGGSLTAGTTEYEDAFGRSAGNVTTGSNETSCQTNANPRGADGVSLHTDNQCDIRSYDFLALEGPLMGIYHQNIYREQAQPVRYAGTTLSLYGLLGVDYFEYQQLGRAIPLERILNDVSITGMNISEPFTHNAEYLPTSDLRTTKTVAGDYFSGGTVTYTITYGNSGFDTDTITITDTLSETWLSGINYTDTRTYNGNGEFETGFTLAAGEMGSLTLDAIIITGAVGITGTNTVSITGVNYELNTGDNSDSVSFVTELISVLDIYFTGSTPADGTISSETTFVGEAETAITDLQKLTWTRDTTDYIFDIGSYSGSDFVSGDYSMTDYSDPDLIFAMNFDSDGDLSDYSSNGNDATNNGATWTNSGRFGGAYSFDGDNNSMTMGDVLNTELTDDTFSISLRFNANSYRDIGGNRGMLFQKRYTSSSSANCFILYGEGYFYTETRGTTFTPATLNERHHITVSMNAGNVSIYIDGELNAEDAGHNCTATTYPLMIGGLYNDVYNFDGEIDDIRIYDRALTAQEVEKLYTTKVTKHADNLRSVSSTQDNLTDGTYTYQACATNTTAQTICTEERDYNVTDLLIEKSSDKYKYHGSDYITYTIDFGLSSDLTLTGLSIEETLVTGLQYISHSFTGDDIYTFATGLNSSGDLLLNWSDIDLFTGATGQIILTAQVVDSFPLLRREYSWLQSGYLNPDFWASNPSSGDIVDALYGTDSSYTQYRNGYTSSSCSVGASDILHYYDGDTIPTTLADNTIYVLHTGNYVSAGQISFGNCVGLIGVGEVELSSSSVIPEQYYAGGLLIVYNKDHTIIDNIKVDGEKGHIGSPNGFGINVYQNSQNNTINNVESYNNRIGISLHGYRGGVKYNVVNNSQTYNNVGAGIRVDTLHYQASETTNTEHNIINNCQSFNNGQGVMLYTVGSTIATLLYNTVNNSQMYNNTMGIYLATADYTASTTKTLENNTFYNNQIYNNTQGIYLNNSAAIGTLQNNTFTDQKVFNNEYGVYIPNAMGINYYSNTLELFANDTDIYNGTLSPVGYANLGRSQGTIITGQNTMSCRQVTNPRDTEETSFYGDVCTTRGNISSWDGQVFGYVYGDKVQKQTQPVRYENTALQYYGDEGKEYYTGYFDGEIKPLNWIMNTVSGANAQLSSSYTINAEYLPTSDLRTTKTVTGDYYDGGTVTYTINYGNSGFDTDTITITDTLSETWLSGVNYINTRTYNGNGEFETGFTLAAGETGSLLLEAMITTGTSDITGTNTVSITGVNYELNTGDNSDIVDFVTEALADVTAPVIYFTGVTPADETISPNTTFTGEIEAIEENLTKLTRTRDTTDYIFNISGHTESFGIGDYSLTDYTDTGLILAMNFDTDGDVSDYSTYGNDGTNNGATWTAAGYYSGAYSFTTNDYISLPNINGHTNYTQSVRIHPDTVAGDFGIIQTNDGFIRILNSCVYYYSRDSRNGGTETIRGANYCEQAIETGTWTQLTVVAQGISSIELYINGQLANTGVSTDNPSATYSQNNIGMFESTRYFEGEIDNIRLYNYALSAEQISQQYNTTVHKYTDTQRGVDVNETDLADGTYSYQATAEDINGLTGETVVRTYTVDTTAPVLENISPASGTVLDTGTVTLTRSGYDETSSISGYQYELLSGGSVVLSGTRTQTGVTITQLDEVSYTWHVRAQDLAGNWSAYTDEREFSVDIDNEAPSIYFTGATPPDGTISANTTFTGEIEAIEANLTKLTRTRDTTDYIFNISGHEAEFGLGEYSLTDYTDTGLMLAMNFDTDGDLNDYSVYKNSGTNYNVTRTENGKYQGAYEFQSGSYITIQDNNSLNGTDKFTISIRNYYNTGLEYENYTSLFNRTSVTGGYMRSRYYSADDRLGFQYRSTTGQIKSLLFYDVKKPNTRQQITFVLEPADENISLYVNGILHESKELLDFVHPNGGDLFVGSYQGAATHSFAGKLDDFRIYNRALTSGEIYQQYTTTVHKYSDSLRGVDVNATDLADGTYSYQAAAEDINGLTGETVVRTYTVDTQAPLVELLSPFSGTVFDSYGPVNLLRSGYDAPAGVSGYIYEIYSGGVLWKTGMTSDTGTVISL